MSTQLLRIDDETPTAAAVEALERLAGLLRAFGVDPAWVVSEQGGFEVSYVRDPRSVAVIIAADGAFTVTNSEDAQPADGSFSEDDPTRTWDCARRIGKFLGVEARSGGSRVRETPEQFLEWLNAQVVR